MLIIVQDNEGKWGDGSGKQASDASLNAVGGNAGFSGFAGIS